MKFVKLLHNPNAGDAGHSVENLATMIEAAGFECDYQSIKKIKKGGVESKVDVVALAGGDGTVRKAAKQLLDEHVPIGLFPFGTANNIATTLAIPEDPKKAVQSWRKRNLKRFDVGHVIGLKEDVFFLEGVGFGVFPTLMDAMKNLDKDKVSDPKDRLKMAIETLHEIARVASSTQCIIHVDGKRIEGNFLLVEVMNIRSIGPNLFLAPHADPGDGLFNVAIVREEERDDFVRYIENLAEGGDPQGDFDTITGKDITIEWRGTALHVDDERIEMGKPAPLHILVEPEAFQFLVP